MLFAVDKLKKLIRESAEFGYRKSLTSDVCIESASRDRVCDLGFCKLAEACRKGVRKSLSSLLKSRAHSSEEDLLVSGLAGAVAVKINANYRRIDLGGRQELARGDLEELLAGSEIIEIRGNRAVIRSTGQSAESVRNLGLDHNRDAVEGQTGVEQLEKDRRCDIIR